ncbi:MAG: AI-2E family transporter [Anaeromyxobacteraceae bacterium]
MPRALHVPTFPGAVEARAPPLPGPDPARTALRAALRIAGLGLALAAAWAAREVLLLGFTALLLSVVLSFPVGWVQRLLPRRGLAVLVVLVLGGGLLGGIGALAIPSLAEEAPGVVEGAPRAIKRARDYLERGRRMLGDGKATPAAPPPAEQPTKQIAEAAQLALPAAAAIATTITEIVLVIVLAAFLAAEPGAYRRGIRRLVPPRHEAVFDEVWERVHLGLRRWVGGILVAMALMGGFTAAGLLAAGVEGWALLGLLTFVGTFVPYAGAVASAVPGLLVAAGQSSRHFLLAMGVYLAVHVLEGYIVEPLVMRRAVSVRPALLLAGQALFGAVFGVLGIVVATPALVCGQVIVEVLWVERRLRKPPAPDVAPLAT